MQISPYGRWTSARFETPDGIRIEDPRQAPKDADQEDVAPEDAQCPPCVSAEREQNSPSLLQRTANGQRVNSESPAAARRQLHDQSCGVGCGRALRPNAMHVNCPTGADTSLRACTGGDGKKARQRLSKAQQHKNGQSHCYEHWILASAGVTKPL